MEQLSFKDQVIINDLANLLRRNGEHILNGSSQLCLTTHSLSKLNHAFRRYSETKFIRDSELNKVLNQASHGSRPDKAKQSNNKEKFQQWRVNAQFLNDFITKTISLKITHGNATMQGPILVARFRSLQVLELGKVPVHMLEGLHKLRGQLRKVVVSRCLQSLQEFLETCGGDQSAPLSWPHLLSACFSYNWINRLDASLRLLPHLELLDLSHNTIDQGENYLEYLTELTRINLGYNMLEALPTFSITSQTKLKTLIIRNNHLDNLSGVEMLVCLEELDAAENFLVDHSNLCVLNQLHHIRKVNLHGNPFCYHQDHRLRSLHQLSSVAILSKQVVFDGKQVTQAEIMYLQSTGKLSNSENPQIPKVLSATQPLSLSFNFDESDSIATSVKSGSSEKKKFRRKKDRSRSIQTNKEDRAKSAQFDKEDRSRLTPTDTEENESLESSVKLSSRESSRESSPKRIVEGQASTRAEIEVLRDYYGVNWLQAMTAKNLDLAGENSVDNETWRDENASEETDGDNKLTGDIPVPTDVNISITREQGETMQQSTETEDDIYLNDNNADLLQSHSDPEDDIEVLPESHILGEESQPFIVMLPCDDLQPQIITVNQRYLIEKDLNGTVKEMLDLKCLQTYQICEEKMSHPNLAEGTEMFVFRAKFDYMKKDRRERIYVMESKHFADELNSLLSPVIAARQEQSNAENMLQCLKCSRKVSKDEADFLKHARDENNLTDHQSKCPHCGSQMLMEIVEKNSQNVTPQGSYSSNSGVYMLSLSSAAVRPDDKQDLRDSGIGRPRSSAFLEELPYVDNGSGMLSTDKPYSINSKEVKEEGSSEKVQSLSNITPQDKCKSRSSVDSDICILDISSDGSCDVIPESSDKTSVDTEGVNRTSCLVKDNDEPVEKPSVKNLNLSGISEEEEFTPVGSPLSNSICSSMVSSVYENSLVANCDENSDYFLNQKNNNLVVENGKENCLSMCNESRLNGDEECRDHAQETSERETPSSTTSTKNDTVLYPDGKTDNVQNENVIFPTNKSSNEWLMQFDGLYKTDFTVVDHRIKLFLDMNVLSDGDDIQCILKCSTVQYLNMSEFMAYLIFSMNRIYILKINSEANSDEIEDMKCIENQPITELQYIDIGLGHQSFRLEFGTDCSSYSFLIRDEQRCKQFINLITDIIHVHNTNTSEDCKLESISKNNEISMRNLEDAVWWQFKQDLDDKDEFELVRYLSGIFIAENMEDNKSVGVAVTKCDIALVLENHQWPLPKLQPPLSSDIRGQQFVLLDRQKINNIATVEICSRTGSKIKLSFFNDISQEEAYWTIVMETSMNVHSLVKSIQAPWEEAFSIELEITPTDFQTVI